MISQAEDYGLRLSVIWRITQIKTGVDNTPSAVFHAVKNRIFQYTVTDDSD